jgi:multidrug efflux system outer membrane protein
MKRISILLLLPLISCTLHPKYARPDVEMPTTWRVETADAKELLSMQWWEQFEDSTLNELIIEALKNNQDLKVAIERVNVFIAELGIANSQLYPQLAANIGASRSRSSQTLLPEVIPSVSNAFSLIFNAQYLVDIWGQVRSQSETAYHKMLASVETRRSVILGLVTSLATTYVQLRQFDKQLMIAKDTLSTRTQAFDLALLRFELGLTSELEPEQSLAEVEQAEVEILRLELAIAEAENLISVLLGKPSMAVPRGKSIDALVKNYKIPSYIPSDILEQRPDICQREQELMAANANIGVAKAAFFPQINLIGALGTDSSFIPKLFQHSSNVWQYGATLLQEIFTGGRLTSNLRLTEAQKRLAIHAYEGTILTAFQEVNDALISNQISKNLEAVQKERVATLSDYLRLSNLRYIEGQTDYLTFLDAERQVFNALLEYTSTQGDMLISLINLYKALGGDWVIKEDK